MKRILVIRGGALGDFLVTLPTLRLLRERWPEAHIELLGHPAIAEPAVGRFYLDAVRSVNHGPLSAFFTPRAVLDPAWMDWIGGFDLVLSYFYDPDELFETNLRRCKPGRVLSHSPRVPEFHRERAARFFAEAVRPLELTLPKRGAIEGQLHFTEADDDAARAFLAGLEPDARLVAIHPGSGGEKKIWPAPNWAELGARLAKRFPEIVFLLVEGEADAEPARIVAEAWRGLHVIRARMLPLSILGALLHRCALFIGHDSGVTHLAAASSSELPIVALFGPTDPAVWAPSRAGVSVLRNETARVDFAVEAVESVAVKELEAGPASRR